MGSIEDHLNSGTVDISAGNVKDLRKNAEGLVGVGTAANPVNIKLVAGTYTLDRPLDIPNYCTISGAGRDATIIQRTVSNVNTAYGTTGVVYCDPVLNMSQSQSVTLENLSVIHSGTSDASVGNTTKSPCAILTGASKKLKMCNVRLEGNWAGWYDKTDSVDSSFSKPIFDNVVGNEDYQYRVDNCVVIGHSVAGMQQVARHELYANGCIFICDIRSGDTLQTSVMPGAFQHWEHAIGYYKSCEFVLRCAQTLTVSSATENATAFVIKDTAITDTIAYLDDCTLYVDLSEGDVNSALSGAACLHISGTAGADPVLYPSNVFKADNCRFKYETGTITSAPQICGLYFEAVAGVNTVVDGYLNSCTFEDIAGSGGTRRRDVIITGRLGNAQARKLEVRNCNIQDYEYRNVSGSPVYTHANFMTEPNTMNYQRGSVAFSPSGTSVAVTMPLAYTASGGITDYAVFLEPNENNTFWVSSKTNSGFTLNASTATAGTIRFVVRR